jgi:hypothetical protein
VLPIKVDGTDFEHQPADFQAIVASVDRVLHTQLL